MKRNLLVLFAVLAFGFGNVFAQHDADGPGKDLPGVTVKDLEGNVINTADFDNDGKPIVISFWATWCKPCILELTTIADDYEDLVDETGVKLIAISIDDARNQAKVAPFVTGRDWEYEVYIDGNQDFKRALSVTNVPHTFVLDGNKKIVWQHPGYQPGDEEELYELLGEMAGDHAEEPGTDGEG
ncbi:MAG: TlpA disulfide reductase family protein, partial [Bacteroidota bacterium]